MIPKDSTPIKNKILIDIIAKGLLSKDELRIIAYIIRWSWGFNGIGRRQDWTKKLTKRKMANDIGMAEQHVGKNINKMIKENIIIVKNGCYQFNEHFEEWKNLPKRLVLKNNKKLTESVSKTNLKGKLNQPNRLVKLTEKVSLGMPNNQGKGIKNKDVRGGEHLSKDTLKDTLKETVRRNDEIISKKSTPFQLAIYLDGKIRENNKRFKKRTEAQLAKWAEDIEKLIRIDKAPPAEIGQVIDWVVEDSFWSPNILSANKLREHYPKLYKKAIDRGKGLEESLKDDRRFDDLK